MKIIIPLTIKSPTRSVMQKLGYFENYDRRTGKTSYIKRLSRDGFYPRFHIYIDENNNGRVINLHLDQKRPSYAGASAHNAEYDSEVVQREGERMKGMLVEMEKAADVITAPPKAAGKEKKINFWQKIKELFLR